MAHTTFFPPVVSYSWRRTLQPYVGVFGILLGAFLISVQMRLRISVGQTLYPNYVPQPVLVFVFMLLASIIGVTVMRALLNRQAAHAATSPAASSGTRRVLRIALSPARALFIALVLAIAIVFFACAFILPDLSLLQLLYFVLFGCAMGFVLILVPARLLRSRKRVDVVSEVRKTWQKRELLALWSVNNISARYKQAVLGVVWIVLLPLAQSFVLALVFSQFFRMDVGDTPYITFFLSAMVPWQFFSTSVLQGASTIVTHMGLINQIYFPREILPLVRLVEAFIDYLFTFVAMLVINLLAGVLPNANYIYIPLLMLILAIFAYGLMLFVSYLTVFVRDIPQLMFVVMQLAFYITPILFPIEFIPPAFRVLTLINPLVPLIQSFRDVIAYNRPPDVISLYYPLVVGVSLLYLGYVFFKAHEKRLTDFV
jgi:ABC-2 type transport system permease protein/lipopolysaccharide transport system permease protein